MIAKARYVDWAWPTGTYIPKGQQSCQALQTQQATHFGSSLAIGSPGLHVYASQLHAVKRTP